MTFGFGGATEVGVSVGLGDVVVGAVDYELLGGGFWFDDDVVDEDGLFGYF